MGDKILLNITQLFNPKQHNDNQVLLTNQNELNALCLDLSNEGIIAFDTEFVRRDTYYPKLSLIQIATKTYTKLIDATVLDLSPLKELLLHPKILKIFHAPKQDFEIFYRVFNALPVNIFDTQIAAGFCAMRSVMSYADLCSEICLVTIDKTHQASDWLKRPIGVEMLEYAAKDVEYLHDLYEYLHTRIDDIEKYHERLDVELLDPKLYQFSPENAWKKVRVGPRSEEFIRKMKVLAAFREEMAAEVDVPRGHFIHDNALIQICNSLPRDDKGFRAIRWQTRWMKMKKYRNKVLAICASLD